MRKIISTAVAALVLASFAANADEFTDSRQKYKDWYFHLEENNSGESVAYTKGTQKSNVTRTVALYFVCDDKDISFLDISVLNVANDYFKDVNKVYASVWIDDVEWKPRTEVFRVDNDSITFAWLDTSKALRQGTELKLKLEILNRNTEFFNRKTEFFTFSLMGFIRAINHLAGKHCTD